MENIIVKISQSKDLCYMFKEPEDLKSIYLELGALENIGFDIPDFFGIILDYRTYLAGIIMEDASKGDKFQIEEGWDGHLQILKVYDEKKIIREVIVDAKRERAGNYIENMESGIKYLNREARIELR